MIASFSVSNFLSFHREETLSLVASKRLGISHENHLRAIPDSNERLLRAAVLYGANGAGKSNLFKALRLLRRLAIGTRDKASSLGRQPFKFGNAPSADSELDLQFIADGKLFRFQVKLDDHRIIEESLARVVAGKERVLYERVSDSAGIVRVDPKPALRANPKLKALCTVGGPPNQTFLATARATLEKGALGGELRAVIRWFAQDLTLISPGETFGPVAHVLNEDPAFLDFASEFLHSASTGIDRLEIGKRAISEEELQRTLPESVFREVMDPESAEDVAGFVVGSPEGEEFLISKSDKQIHMLSIQSIHKDTTGNPVPFQLAEESDGTRRLLELTPTLRKEEKKENAVIFIDEIDRSLHPILVYKFLEFFLRSCPVKNSQIITTTHETNLLNHELLRRDEIWFVEKDKENATRLYSLSDFKVRNDLEIRRHYLQGRFGAIPFLGSMDNLLQMAGCDAETTSPDQR